MKLQRWRHVLLGALLGGAALFSSLAGALEVGDKAPDFALPSAAGPQVKLADFLGKKHVVLFFYIGAFTDA